MGIDESLVQEIVRRILSVTTPDRIIIFGSAATGNMTRDSDIDILVVEREPGDRRKKSVEIDAALSGLGYPFDVIVISTEWFEASKNVIGGIAYPAYKYGKVVYEAKSDVEDRQAIADNIKDRMHHSVRNQKGGKSMAGETSPSTKKKDSIARDLADLIKTAQEQPGVQDFMEVYNTWKTFDAVHQNHQRVVAVKRVVALSDSSVSDLT